MRFPNFIIIGAMKCGTTVMWHNMNNHPDITMGKNWSDPKKASTEIRFWNNGSPHHTWRNGIDWYKRQFIGNGRWSHFGEKCANYIESTKAMRRISEHIPDVKLILCVRNPIDRVYSEFNMMRKTNPSRYRMGFRKLLRKDKGFIKRGMYYQQIQKSIIPFFPLENLCISVQERMKHDTNRELNRVYDFIGVKRIDMSVREISDKNRDVFIDDYKKWSSRYAPLSDSDRSFLADIYEDANREFYNFLGEEIDEWEN